jgi:tRNA pseudouridine38-40 synthase
MHVTCSLCHAPFFCGARDTKNPCWCKKKPIVPIKDDASCRCEKCLDAISKAGTLTCFRLHLSYVGEHFAGFQQQANARSVEGELKAAFKKLTNQDVKLIAAGRTDSGVHARGQVVTATFVTKLNARQLTLALVCKLPKDMAVFKIDQMPLGFDARRQSIGKQYVYRIMQGSVADPFWRGRALHVPQKLDIERMAEAAKLFEGHHDFQSFRGILCRAYHARRFVWHVGVSKVGALIEIDVRGNAFCLNMVRIMVGTIIEVGRGKRSLEAIATALKGSDRNLAGETAKAHGLTLEKVYYPDDLASAKIPQGASFPRYPISSESWPFDEQQIVYGAS